MAAVGPASNPDCFMTCSAIRDITEGGPGRPRAEVIVGALVVADQRPASLAGDLFAAAAQ